MNKSHLDQLDHKNTGFLVKYTFEYTRKYSKMFLRLLCTARIISKELKTFAAFTNGDCILLWQMHKIPFFFTICLSFYVVLTRCNLAILGNISTTAIISRHGTVTITLSSNQNCQLHSHMYRNCKIVFHQIAAASGQQGSLYRVLHLQFSQACVRYAPSSITVSQQVTRTCTLLLLHL